MIKLVFDNFSFTTDGIVSKGTITGIIKIFIKTKWHVLSHRNFTAKVTLHKEEKADLNKAYKYVQAKLEKDAYKWAQKEIFKELLRTQKDLKIFNDFVEKAKHIIVHDTAYLNQF